MGVLRFLGIPRADNRQTIKIWMKGISLYTRTKVCWGLNIYSLNDEYNMLCFKWAMFMFERWVLLITTCHPHPPSSLYVHTTLSVIHPTTVLGLLSQPPTFWARKGFCYFAQLNKCLFWYVYRNVNHNNITLVFFLCWKTVKPGAVVKYVLIEPFLVLSAIAVIAVVRSFHKL